MNLNHRCGKKTITSIIFFILIVSIISITTTVNADETTFKIPNRTGDIFNDFLDAFEDADITILADIYEVAGREENIDVSSELLAEKICKNNVKYIGSIENIYDYLKSELEDKDIVITMGAGTITNLSDQLVEYVNDKR